MSTTTMTIRHDGSPPTADPAAAATAAFAEAIKYPKDSQLESKEPTKHMEVGEAGGVNKGDGF